MTPALVADSERPRPDWLRANPRAWLAAVFTVCFGAFMGQLDASVVTLTYRPIGREFGAGLGAVQWVSLTYLAALAGLLVPLGRLSDRIGRKRVYLWGFGLFSLASAGCALAPTLASLAAIRAVQGAGAAMLQANSVAIVTTAAPRSRLRSALGLQAAAQAIGLALGPTVGGMIVQTIGWRWVFAVNVPVGVVAIVAGRYLLPRTRFNRDVRPRGRDVIGQPGVLRGLAGAWLAYLLLFGPIVLVPALLLSTGRSAVVAGAVVAALPVGFALGALLGERLLPHGWPGGRRALTGVVLAAGGLAGVLLAGTGVPALTLALAACGLGLGVFTPANNAAIMAAVPPASAALAGGLVSAARALGTAAGTVLVAASLPLGHRAPAAALLGLAVLTAATCGPVVSRARR